MHACAATGKEGPLDRDTASERTYSSRDRGLRHELGMSDPVAQVTCRLSKGEALIVISFTSLALRTVIVTAICSLAPALFPSAESGTGKILPAWAGCPQ